LPLLRLAIGAEINKAYRVCHEQTKIPRGLCCALIAILPFLDPCL
jgi:hypothetical protein